MVAGDATREIPRLSRGRVAPRGGGARAGRAGHGRRRDGDRPGARRRRRATPSRSTGDRSTPSRPASCTRVNKPAGVVSTARDPQKPPDGRLARPEQPPPVSRRSARHRHDRADPADQRRRARPPPDPPPLRGREDLPRGRSRAPPVREPALGRCATGVELEDGRTAPARGSADRPDTIELTIHEGRKRQVKRMCEHVGHPRPATGADPRSGRSSSATCRPGEHRRLSRRRARAQLARRPAERLALRCRSSSLLSEMRRSAP